MCQGPQSGLECQHGLEGEARDLRMLGGERMAWGSKREQGLWAVLVFRLWRLLGG